MANNVLQFWNIKNYFKFCTVFYELLESTLRRTIWVAILRQKLTL